MAALHYSVTNSQYCSSFRSLLFMKGSKPKHAASFTAPNRDITSGCQVGWPRPLRCFASRDYQTNNAPESNCTRRSANYKPNLWKGDFLKSLKSDYNEEMYTEQKETLKEEVRHWLDINDVMMPVLARLELIDDLERLGLGYHFEKEIGRALESIACTMVDKDNNGDYGLHETAQCFRLLRQHGYKVSQDVFKQFLGQEGEFMACHQKDVKGMLSLYEASNIAVEDESILERARKCARGCLKANDRKGMSMKPDMLTRLVDHSLDLPLHLRAPRLEARWYIDHYQRREDANHMLLELAKLDFNLVQAIHQEDLIEIMKWWSDLRLADNLSFSRDRPVECFFFTMGLFSEPQLRYCRKEITKILCLIITIDDIYDIYGTLGELELFTDAVTRWDINASSQLPHYMKMCFLALYNTVNQIAYDTLKEKNCDILPYLKKAWVDLCEAFLVEAKWYQSGYIPTFEEYMNNALISAGGPLIIHYTYFLLGKEEVEKEELKCFLESKSNLVRGPSIVVRLTDDLATSTAEMQRGDTPKSIHCYMHETGASEGVAREYVKHLVDETWKKINEELCMDSGYPRTLTFSAVNLARMSESVFLYGDVLAVQVKDAMAQVLTFFVDPV